ncbi:helix-turn-helix domain-containing protein [Methylopila sp. M107]|uniref:helix-turn-helix domain-containing protein n=1 Tax=Methylopila sp. M107 TaxID=1101190 RepID=UPI0009DBB79F|nr:helix-turn-helix domain-containing protein [Methylopila sp. M107]
MPEEAKVWDRHAILAEVRRRGLTLTGIALDAGLYESACRQGLNGGSLKGAQAIAEAIGVSVKELFPDRFTSRRPAHQNRIRKPSESASQKRAPRADIARVG